MRECNIVRTHLIVAVTVVPLMLVKKEYFIGLFFSIIIFLLKTGETLSLVCSYFLSGDTE